MTVRIMARGGYRNRFGDLLTCGTVVELPDRLAIKLCKHGFAVPVREQEPENTKRKSAPERTTRSKKGAK